MRHLFLVLSLGTIFGLACGSSQPETPHEGLEVIMSLLEDRDFDTLVRTRYAEIDKAESEEQIVALVGRFESRFQNPESLDEILSNYRTALEKTPEFTAEDDVALFKLGDGVIRMSRMADGRWGFHL
jgi:hypothetical protein